MPKLGFSDGLGGGSAWFQACSLMKHALARFTRSGTKTRERPRLSASV